jgi:glutamyl-tRNA reductase
MMAPERPNTERQSNCRDDATDTEIDPDWVWRRLHRRSARIERREVEEALSKLEACSDLTDEQRRTVRQLGDSLAWRLTLAPELALKRSSRDEQTTVCTVARLFDLSPETRFDSDCE